MRKIIPNLSICNILENPFQFRITDNFNQLFDVFPSSIIENKFHQYIIADLRNLVLLYIPKKMLVFFYEFSTCLLYTSRCV